MDSAQVGDLLALVNASLNATSAVALLTSYYFVRSDRYICTGARC